MSQRGSQNPYAKKYSTTASDCASKFVKSAETSAMEARMEASEKEVRALGTQLREALETVTGLTTRCQKAETDL